ncbi:MAG: hypothetical protein ACKVS9_08585, partial [Phycisphaerae bacterium]
MESTRLEHELAELRRRISELEAHVGLSRPASAASPADVPAATQRTMQQAAEILRRVATPQPPTPTDPIAAPPAVPQPPPVPDYVFAESADNVSPTERMVADDRGSLVPESTLTQGTHPRTDNSPAKPPAIGLPPMSRADAAAMELRVGGNWMAWAGALLVILASGFFVKFAYDQGWLGLIPKVIRCLLCAAL